LRIKIGNIIYGGEILLEAFKEYLALQGKSKNTINSYYLHMKGYHQFLRVRESESPYLFANSNGKVIHRSTVNKVFNKYSDKITPHTLRHYFCTIALEGGLSVHEVAYLAGHSNIHITLIYLNPSREAIRGKINNL
jgi:site-specific recombinase XerD